MSYDLQIWSVRAFDPRFLKKANQWQGSSDSHWTLGGRNWQIVINPSDKVLPEDVPDEVAELLPGIAHLTELNLEGDAPATAMKLLKSTAKEIAKVAHGVIEDQQEDKLTTPSGVKRFSPPKKQNSFSVLSFSWWYLNDLMLGTPGRMSFLSLLEELLPEALPRRYGEYEPPQYVFEKTGKKHLSQLMSKTMDTVMVWYPNRPVTHVHVSCPKPLGPSRQGFRTHIVEIEIESAVLAQPGWPEHLQRFWHEMTFLLQPIYGEVRSSGGHYRVGASVMVDATAIQNHYPTTNRSWFFRGIPTEPGHAVVLGKEYQKAWPQFMAKATKRNGYAFATTGDWSSEDDLTNIVGTTPKPLALLPGEGMGRGQRYPEFWPFGPTFGDAE